MLSFCLLPCLPPPNLACSSILLPYVDEIDGGKCRSCSNLPRCFLRKHHLTYLAVTLISCQVPPLALVSRATLLNCISSDCLHMPVLTELLWSLHTNFCTHLSPAIHSFALFKVYPLARTILSLIQYWISLLWNCSFCIQVLSFSSFQCNLNVCDVKLWLKDRTAYSCECNQPVYTDTHRYYAYPQALIGYLEQVWSDYHVKRFWDRWLWKTFSAFSVCAIGLFFLNWSLLLNMGLLDLLQDIDT